jgi:biopolymer transport protein ExbD
MAKQTITVYINDLQNFYVEEQQVDPEILETQLALKLENQPEGTVVLRADKTVPVQHIVTVIDAVNAINQAKGTKHKVILATLPK